ncbi:beta-ketoacyl synthase N-terminal-like domain-containing protein [Halomarina halobia]|uniref:Beta-ketoacyl synthase N-terminal-like domain-containing protein n=1 Tax=Halomarina halobia TaxID=3033386 RepID=A0ABD6AEJ2_9EURY|nr:beta-ketoacyl synthase N-terminal-like domain-containing protein [Halomarina sp. PSR21]
MTDGEVAVVGVGQSDFGELEGQRVTDFGGRAVREALLASGLDSDAIEEAYVGNVASAAQRQTGVVGQAVLREVGVTGLPITRVENACASSTCAFREAYRTIRSGERDVVLALGVEKMTGVPTDVALRDMSGASDAEVEGPMGMTFMGVYGMRANAYADRFGDVREELADIAVKNHSNGLANPRAHLHLDVDREDVLSSRMIADPIRLLDACPMSDGAAAAVLARGEVAERLVDQPVYVDAVEASSGHYLDGDLEYWREELDERVSRRAYREAGIGPDDLDVVEVHDAATIGELMHYEGLGLASHGEGASLVRKGDVMLDGRIPVNPSGGLKSRGHPVGATGVAQVCELVWQLRGEAGKRQVDGASIGLAQNSGGALLGEGGVSTVTVLSAR